LTALCITPSIASAQSIPESTYQELRWRMIGPYRGGRTRAAAGVPGQPNVFYIGVADGGVWKSDDYGRTWLPIFDSQATQSIGAIAVAPSDPNIVYAASGEGLRRPDLSVGDGIYRSSDAGKSWAHLGLNDAQQIPALAVDPRDPNRLFAAVLGHPYGPNEQRGIFVSNDGGKTWDRVLYKDANTGGSDVEIDPSNPDVIYAALWESRLGPWEDGNQYGGANSGLFKSTDGGKTWRPLTAGLPKNLLQINVAVAPADPKRVYAVVGTSEAGDYASGKGLGLYRSDDSGETWSRITDDPRPVMRIGGGDLPIVRVDPKNPEVVYSTSLETWRSADGGKTWSAIRGAPGGDDYQNIWINPNDPDILLLVSDQGALVTVNGGATWSSWYNQPTAQIYHVSVTKSFPYMLCGGQQESGSVCISSRGNDGEITVREWHPVSAIEYGYVAPDPLDLDVIYGGGRTEVSKFHWSTGQSQNVTPIPVHNEKYRADRTEPTIFSPVDPHILYYATNVLFQTTDGGNSWQEISPDLSREHNGIPSSIGNLAGDDKKAATLRGVIYCLAPSFKDVKTLWAGTDDGFVWRTADGGKNWSNIAPHELTPWSKVTQISASHFDEQTAYVSVSRLRIDDLHPYIFRTHDAGKTWQPIVNGLPGNSPVDTVREDPVRKGLLFAGTETAVWVSFDDGDHWQPLQLNLPHTSMRDLWIHEDDLIVATHGRGFWILDDIATLRQLNASTAKEEAILFKPAPAYRVQRDTNTDTPIPADEPTAENPPNGAVIDYFLGHAATDGVSIEILDAQGRVVRRFSSADATTPSSDDLRKQLIPPMWSLISTPPPSTAGMHRFVWDLTYPAPVSTQLDYPSSAVPHGTPRQPLGPRALPGSYTIRLIVDGVKHTEPLTIRLDPRLKVTEVDLERQLRLQLRLAEMRTQVATAVLQARSLRDQLRDRKAAGNSAASETIEEFERKLGVVLDGAHDAVPNPAMTLNKINGDITALYDGVDRADAAPTAAQVSAAAGAERDLPAVMKQWEHLKAVDLPALNAALRSANQDELRLDLHPQPQTAPEGDIE